MAVVNSVGNSLTGLTGTGAFVGANTPTLITPALGVATATSVNFGQDALNYYDEGTWTPVLTCATPGDLSVVYTTQTGTYIRIGKVVYINMVLNATPTFTTASGTLRVTGVPFTSTSIEHYGAASVNANFNWQAGRTNMNFFIAASSTIMSLLATGSGVAANAILITYTTSAVALQINATGFYFTS